MIEKVKCLVCKKIFTSKDAFTHMQKTDHNLWELLLEPPHELINECCGKPESECRCVEIKPDEDTEKVKAILETETAGGYLHNFADFKRLAPPKVVKDYINTIATQICQLFDYDEPKINPYTLPSQAYDEYFTPLESKPNDELLLDDNEIAEVAIVCWVALDEHERRSFRLVAKAQLTKARPLIEKQERERIIKEIESKWGWATGKWDSEDKIMTIRYRDWQALKGER